jgi:hypothetical protein
MPQLRILADQTVESTERLLEKIATHSLVDLLLPLRHGKRGLLSDAALIQTLITWSSNHPEGRILTYVNDEQTLSEFCQTDIGFIVPSTCGGAHCVHRNANRVGKEVAEGQPPR